MNTVGERLKTLREGMKFSQKKMAELHILSKLKQTKAIFRGISLIWKLQMLIIIMVQQRFTKTKLTVKQIPVYRELLFLRVLRFKGVHCLTIAQTL